MDSKASAAASAFVDEDYAKAAELFTEAISACSDNAQKSELFARRAACFLKLKRTMEALSDSKSALQLDPKSSSGWFRNGEALFELGEFEAALSAFESGAQSDPEKSAKWDMWQRKCKAELAAEEKKEVKTTTTASEVKPTPAQPSAPAPVQKIRHEWYQTDSHVVVTIFCKGLKREQVRDSISTNSYSIVIDVPGSSEPWHQEVQLCAAIVPAESKVELLSTKIELWLKKQFAARWPSLELAKAGNIPLPAPAPGVMLPPTTTTRPEPYASKKKVNWDAVVAAETDLDSDDPLNKVFKDIFGKGTDEQRRAMMKSYQESGGTVLSTNWEDVGKKKVEVSPPDGMIAKKWGTDEVVAEGGKKEKK